MTRLTSTHNPQNIPDAAMRFHVISLPHTQTTLEYEACAYTSKQRKLCDMLKSLGHTVYLYASEENEAACDELITIAPKQKQQQWFGNHDFKNSFFNIKWQPELPYWKESNSKAIKEITKRIRPGDFICVVAGNCQRAIADKFANNMTVETGVGYSGVFSKYRVFESYAWMHYIYGLLGTDSGNFYDTVIPNYYEPELYEFRQKKDDYYLFLGRFMRRKGPGIAAEVTKHIGAKLIMAGQGVIRSEGNRIFGHDVEVEGAHIKHVGFADVKKRSRLLSRAKGVFVSTTYLEPFGGVSIEAMLCGTPVIATDFGAFSENVIHGKTGWRFRTIGEAIWAARHVDDLKPKIIRDYAVNNFGTERIKYLYQAYFEQLRSLQVDGIYSDWDAGVAKYQRYSRR